MKQWVEWVVEYAYRRKEIQEFLGLFFFPQFKRTVIPAI